MQLISSSKNPFSSNESSFSGHKNTPDNNTLTDLNSAIHCFFHVEGVKNYQIPKEIEEAFRMAERFHEGQMRKTGEEYIQHPIRCAIAVIEKYGKDFSPKQLFEAIIIALLHDVIEDSYCDEKHIEEAFQNSPSNIDNSVIAKSVFLMSKEPWENFVEDGLLLQKNPEEAKEKAKQLRDKKYYGRLKLLAKKTLLHQDIVELGLEQLTPEQISEVQKMVLLCKGVDNIDNISTLSKKDTVLKRTQKVKQSIDYIIPNIPKESHVLSELRKTVKEAIFSHKLHIIF